MRDRREGMLRPEFRDWYPGIQAERWYPAADLTGLVVDHLQHGSPQWRAEGRVPSDDHFIFRGSSGRRGGTRRTRSSDRPPRHADESRPAQLDS